MKGDKQSGEQSGVESNPGTQNSIRPAMLAWFGKGHGELRVVSPDLPPGALPLRKNSAFSAVKSWRQGYRFAQKNREELP
jgi:hypothetical protein